MNNVIKIENLYKEYRLGVIGHGTLYRDLQSFWANIRGRDDPNSIIGNENIGINHKRNILALKNINLEVQKGEVLGIIGQNGAGKSTLLKILSRITSPTKGIIKIKGNVASLLEVGTGFHTELTGRENIYLNGAINGMNKKEIDKKLDEIVDFAGVEKFLDTPVKRYSSGMIVRLGFAVSAYIEPDILIVDEVLAVGDASFQKKAINKMKDVSSNHGRTVLFVSHNMNSIRKLCNSTVLIESGQIIKKGNTETIIDHYLNFDSESTQNNKGHIEWDEKNMPGNNLIKLKSVKTKKSNNTISSTFDVVDDIIIEFEIKVMKNETQLATCLDLTTSSNPSNSLIRSVSNYDENSWENQKSYKKGNYISRCKIPKNLLGEGVMNISLRIFTPPYAANLSENVKAFNVLSFYMTDSFDKTGSRGNYPYNLGDVIRPKLEWDIENII